MTFAWQCIIDINNIENQLDGSFPTSSLARSLISVAGIFPTHAQLSIIPVCPGRWNRHRVPKRRLIYFGRWGNSQKNTYYKLFCYMFYTGVTSSGSLLEQTDVSPTCQSKYWSLSLESLFHYHDIVCNFMLVYFMYSRTSIFSWYQ